MCFYAGDVIENFANFASGSVPRAVASGAFEKDVLLEPRSLPLAVLTRRSEAQFEILQALDLIFVQTLTASGPVWRLTNSRDQSGPQHALKRHRKDRNISAAGSVYVRRKTHGFALIAQQEVEVCPQITEGLIN